MAQNTLKKGFRKATKKKMAAIEKGMGRAGLLLLGDASTETPKTPHDKGTLRGSGSVHVQNKLVGVSPPEGDASPATDISEPLSQGTITVTVGFNTPYAARLHEHPEYQFKESGTGGKFLERPMAENAKLYLKEVARTVRRAGF